LKIKFKKSHWHNLEHKIFKSAKGLGIENLNLLVACSGGQDSMALVAALKSISSALKLNLTVLHFHHGKSKNSYRDKALWHVKNFCNKNKILFHCEVHDGVLLKNEKEFREARYNFFRKYLTANSVLVTAHHADDLLETRLIQLIRGGGIRAFKSMAEKKSNLWRPFLSVSRMQIEDFVKEKKIKFIQDPSNHDLKFFRNWIRNHWLPELENYRSGSVKALSRSFKVVADSLTEETSKEFVKRVAASDLGWSLDLPYFWALSESEKKNFLAYFLKLAKGQNYTLSQALEVKKQLDQTKKIFEFQCAGLEWKINAKQLIVRKL